MNPKSHKTMKIIVITIPLVQRILNLRDFKPLTSKKFHLSPCVSSSRISRCPQDCQQIVWISLALFCCGSKSEIPFQEKVWHCHPLDPCCLKTHCHNKYYNTSHTGNFPLISRHSCHKSRADPSSSFCLDKGRSFPNLCGHRSLTVLLFPSHSTTMGS